MHHITPFVVYMRSLALLWQWQWHCHVGSSPASGCQGQGQIIIVQGSLPV